MPVERVLVAWGKPSTDWQSRFGPDVALAVQAYGEAHAHQLLRQAKLLPADAPPPRLKELIRTRGLSVWVVPSSGGGEATTRPSDRVQ